MLDTQKKVDTIKQIVTLVTEQAKFLNLTSNEDVEAIYNSINEDAVRFGYSSMNLSFDKKLLAATKDVKQGQYFQFLKVNEDTIVVTNRYFKLPKLATFYIR